MNYIQKYPAFFQEVGHSQGRDAAGATMQAPLFLMASTIIGHHEFPPHKVAGVDLSQVNSTTEMPMDVILGYSTLRQAHWVFDFPARGGLFQTESVITDASLSGGVPPERLL
jgi:hypothetical protein